MPDFRLSVSTLELLKRKIFVKSKIHTLSLYSDILRKIHLKSLKVKVSRVCKIFHENYKFGHFDHFLFFFSFLFLLVVSALSWCISKIFEFSRNSQQTNVRGSRTLKKFSFRCARLKFTNQILETWRESLTVF